ncbi:hypothetical protein N0B44_15695 [Roseibacterium beibuensis]|uniref:GcrA cell cycle regulator n=1 Tax=[Roseibacterium] beibuensis TaxID=1193142 RepID=A0ABP9LE85_9RHOB|nr:hypothetical protein [Roseibacterium beibuensis]MCS6624362.1 hypothetical protein [Roseibacterium beibuensis]
MSDDPRRKIDYQQAARAWCRGDTCTEIGDRYGVRDRAVSAAARRLGWPPRRTNGTLAYAGRPGLRTFLPALWGYRVPVADLARAFGVTEIEVLAVAEAKGLAAYPIEVVPTECPTPAAPAQEARPLPGRDVWTAARDEAIRDTKGRYSELAQLAAQWGEPIRSVQARWHRVRAGA